MKNFNYLRVFNIFNELIFQIFLRVLDVNLMFFNDIFLIIF